MQVTPTSPEILAAEISEGRRGATAGAVGDWALLPIIAVRFHPFSTITTLEKNETYSIEVVPRGTC